MPELNAPGRLPKRRHGNPNAKQPKVRHRMSAWLSLEVYGWVRQRIVAAGGDPRQIPDQSPRLLRMPEVMQITGLSMTTVYGLAKKNLFPKPISLDSRPKPPEAAA